MATKISNQNFYKKRLTLIFVILVTLVSFTLRFHNLGKIPNGLTVDEADMGYNAYSILNTGKDVYGQRLPLFFQSLDDYKPGFAIYSTIPAIKLFGLSDYSVRLFPALIGFFTPILVFIFLSLLYPKNKSIAYVSFMLVSFAPWNVAISRATFMYVELVFFVICSLIFFLLGIKKKPAYLIISAVLLSFTLYIYYAAVIYIPSILIILGLVYGKDLIKFKKYSLISLIALLIIAVPAILHFSQPNSKSRFNAISIFTPDISLPLSIKEIDLDKNSNNNSFTIFHNRRYIYFLNFVNNYLKYYDPDYLFVNSNNVRYFYVNYIGLFYLIELPFFLFGISKILSKKENNKVLILALMLIGAFPAAITLGAPFPHRGILLPLSIQIIIAIGFTDFLKIIQPKYKKVTLIILTVAYIASVANFAHQYIIHSPQEFNTESNNGAWFSSVRDIIPKVNLEKSKYDKVIFSWSQGKLVPPIYFLFYSKIDPQIIQGKSAAWTFEPPSFKQIYNKIDNIEFRPINWEVDKTLKNTLLIGYTSEFPKVVENVTTKSYDQDGQPHFIFVANP